MDSVEQFIKKDGRNQCITGAILFLFGAGSLMFFLASDGGTWLMLIYGAPALGGGLYFIQSGWKDLVKAGSTADMTMDTDDDPVAFTSVPHEMYLGRGEDQGARFFNMSGTPMGDILEKTTVMKKMAGSALSLHLAHFPLPSVYQVQESGETLYEIEKKGFALRSKAYVKRGDGIYVAVMEEKKDKKNKQTVFTYRQKEDVLYQTSGDPYIGKYSIKDNDGQTLVTLKKGAVPVGAADSLQRMNGSVLEWEQREDIPYTLLIFLFFLEHREQ
ncbi:hypothetical protein [Salimicrobium flavidum]|uniref:Uncharacterized protein n=1 Tax=Salimicrobium flavidum TaxID=570947 RepID=A0A1N7J1V7_9BACI|nr:hypothetical protein [Salimicrobium flavidum]SIS43246.1 hypothetical protein SAMN05421687_103194 [Salimicrobium flavidum]